MRLLVRSPVGLAPASRAEFFSFNRFDATNPAPADELMASFPRLRFMLPEIVLIENERGRFAGELAGSGRSRSRGCFTRMVASGADPPAHDIPFGA